MSGKWTTIKIPKAILPLIQELRERTGKPSWQILVEALSFYKSSLTSSRHFSNTTEIDRAAYYIMKLVTSATYFKMQRTRDSFAKFAEVIEQVEKRVGIECGELREAAKKLLNKNVTGRDIHTLNMALKLCVIKMIEKLM